MTSLAFAAPRRYIRDPRRSAAHVPSARVPRRAATRSSGATRARASTPRARRVSPRARSGWELRSFLGASAAIAVAFVLALTYLAGSTGVASAGYEAQRLASLRDELRRQNALLELELARLDAPGRIEVEAKRLGLVRLAFVPTVAADPLAARR